MSVVREATSDTPASARAQNAPPAPERCVRVVVGARIKAQCADPRLITVTDAIWLIERCPRTQGALVFAVGQGCDDESLNALYAAAARHADTVSMEPPLQPRRASAAATHKHVPRNIAITQPYAAGDGTYGCSLLLDEASADISDHLTGRHVPGQMIAEAVRQTAIAVTESFMLPSRRALDSRFVTHEIAVTYADFMLPLPIEIRCVPIKLRRAGGSNLRVTYEIRFFQLAHATALAQMCLSVVERRYFDTREAALLDTLCASLAATRGKHPTQSLFSELQRSEP